MLYKQFIFLLFLLNTANAWSPTSGYWHLEDIAPEIKKSPRYYGSNNFQGKDSDNFMGKRLEMYHAPEIVLHEKTLHALKLVNAEFQREGYTMVIYYGYLPAYTIYSLESELMKSTVDKKSLYFPFLTKSEIFSHGYFPKENCKHGYESGVVVGLNIITNGENVSKIKEIQRSFSNGVSIIFLDDNTIDMGTHFDFFGSESHHDNLLISQEHQKNRKYLKSKMEKYGFYANPKKWWEYTLIDKDIGLEQCLNFYIQ